MVLHVLLVDGHVLKHPLFGVQLLKILQCLTVDFVIVDVESFYLFDTREELVFKGICKLRDLHVIVLLLLALVRFPASSLAFGALALPTLSRRA